MIDIDPDISHDDFQEVVKLWEESQETGGWDQNPELVIVHHDTWIVLAMAGMPPLMALSALPPAPSATALLFMVEVWTFPDHITKDLQTYEQFEAYVKEHGPPSEHPERLDIRVVVGITDRHEVGVARKRGREPQIVHLYNDPQSRHFFAQFLNELRRIKGKLPGVVFSDN